MHLSRRIAALLAAALVAGAPAVAHAQGSAGDEQYQDPFGGATNGAGQKSGASKGSGSSSSGSSTPAPSSGSTSSAPTPAPASSSTGSATSSGSAAASAPAPSTRQELPRTGLDAPVIALLGIGLLAAGVGLRLRLRAVDGRR